MGFMNPDDKDHQQCVGNIRWLVLFGLFVLRLDTIIKFVPCVDINECQIFNNLCVYGKCENLVGMFKCECNPGYQIDNTGGNRVCTTVVASLFAS